MQYALQKGRSIAATTEDFMPIFDFLLLSGYHTVLNENLFWSSAKDKELKLTGRSAFDFKTGAENRIIAVGWFGNRRPTTVRLRILVSNPNHLCEDRMSGSEKLGNILVALFHVDHKSQKWTHRILLPIISNAITNAWQLYKYHSKLVH
ncbi:hypothetical protein T12_3874 [Trichinella patagoniensis]|uniref:PiggyBac transposable element-derived protein domain-containing protein n=1 Tax=Trichinella patagoniensis TaxID=990121 RepID=A0A0V0ZUM4_9BILA|nr:hypothetical protein T12_3874 [Trichinella patagoniensis]